MSINISLILSVKDKNKEAANIHQLLPKKPKDPLPRNDKKSGATGEKYCNRKLILKSTEIAGGPSWGLNHADLAGVLQGLLKTQK